MVNADVCPLAERHRLVGTSRLPRRHDQMAIADGARGVVGFPALLELAQAVREEPHGRAKVSDSQPEEINPERQHFMSIRVHGTGLIVSRPDVPPRQQAPRRVTL